MQNLLSNRIKIDSRQVVPGDWFVAIRGKKFDGHDFIPEAIKNGAIGIVAQKSYSDKIQTIGVADTLIALGEIARRWRQQFTIPIVGITGSCGKTTVRDLLADILKLKYGNDKVLTNQCNYNNEIGLPLTVLELSAQHKVAVLELGARHIGDIKYLSQIAEPTHCLINNVSAAHVGVFGSLKNIAQAKGELYEALPSNGWAIINADDQFADYFYKINRAPNIYSFSLGQHEAQITAKNIKLMSNSSEFELQTPLFTTSITLPTPGKHMIANALAAAGLALSLDCTLVDIKNALENFTCVTQRLEFKPGINNTIIIDDTYNASFSACQEALKVLKLQAQDTKILVIGDMLELGEQSQQLHTEIGELAHQLAIDYIFAFGSDSKYIVGPNCFHFNSHAELLLALQPYLLPNTVILVKGSRGMQMEKIVEQIVTQQEHSSCSFG